MAGLSSGGAGPDQYQPPGPRGNVETQFSAVTVVYWAIGRMLDAPSVLYFS